MGRDRSNPQRIPLRALGGRASFTAPGPSIRGRLSPRSQASKRTDCGCAWSAAMAPIATLGREQSASRRRPSLQGHCRVHRRAHRIPEAARAPDHKSLRRPRSSTIPCRARRSRNDNARARRAGARPRSKPGGTIGDRAWSSVDVAWGSLHAAMRREVDWDGASCPPCRQDWRRVAPATAKVDIVSVGGFLRYEWERRSMAI